MLGPNWNALNFMLIRTDFRLNIWGAPLKGSSLGKACLLEKDGEDCPGMPPARRQQLPCVSPSPSGPHRAWCHQVCVSMQSWHLLNGEDKEGLYVRVLRRHRASRRLLTRNWLTQLGIVEAGMSRPRSAFLRPENRDSPGCGFSPGSAGGRVPRSLN